ncbi:hypothetical protein FIBSPDRAFT_1050839 [Athelia psychrophila]|uniref:Uncharacterized protein n=1 Tax=Athelia psychrophila TaxID=1759441 RepID=A0A166A704_9AGAM|nr:hypothetical protein FIBSPDRAFT_1050839 [Fibularhizoctonia sp. CBS 109695]
MRVLLEEKVLEEKVSQLSMKFALLSPSRSSKQPDVDPDPDAVIASTSPPAPTQHLGITHDPYGNVPDSYQAKMLTDAEAQDEDDDDDQDLPGTDTVDNIKTATTSDTVTAAPLGLITQAVHRTEVEDDKRESHGGILIKTEDTEAAQTHSDTESDTWNLAATASGALGVDNLATVTHDDEGTGITGSSASE